MIEYADTVPIRHKTCLSHNCLSPGRDASPPGCDSIARELLTYLGHLPGRLHKNDLTAAELALMLGNALVWVHHRLEPNKPQVETAIGENPQTVYALGKQFQAVGRAQLFEKTPEQQQYAGVLKLIADQGELLDEQATILAGIKVALDRLSKGGKK